jgi:predicted nucleic acid-binding protein
MPGAACPERPARSGLIEATDLPERHREAMSLVHRFIDEIDLFPEVLTVSEATGHTVYAMLYALTARRQAAVLLTFDRRLHAVCQNQHIASEVFGSR